MKKTVFKISLLAMLIVILAISLVGCGKISEDEAKTYIKDLVEKSYDLNDIYFGKGLNYVDNGNPNDSYMVVSVTERYITKNALIIATRQVFSQTYAQSLIDGAFSGYGSPINQNSVMSRYSIFDEDGLIYVNKNYEALIEQVRTYNFENIEITKISRRFVEANIFTEKNEKVKVVLVKENNEWRLDSATY